MMDAERAARCAACRSAIEPEEQVYRLRIELFASPKPPEFDDRDMVADLSVEWERLMSQLHAMDELAVREEEAKVFERHEFALCGRCREAFHEQLKALTG